MMTERVVLDTNYYRGANVVALETLRQRGYTLSLSATAFMEHGTRLVREKRIGMLVSRARRLKLVIDRELPIIPTGRELVGMVGGRFIDGSECKAREFLEWTRIVWSHLTEAERVDEAWLQRGVYAGDWMMKSNAETWRALRVTPSPLPSRLITMPADRAVAELAAEMAVVMGDDSIGFDHARWDGFYRTSAYMILRDLRRPPEQRRRCDNDAEDIGLLQHIGQPAILATRDFALIAALDASGSCQAPWVRTLGELLADPPPHSPSWGRRASKQCAIFRRRTDLAVFEERAVRKCVQHAGGAACTEGAA